MTTQPDFREVSEDFLEHFGKKGMKWGQRTHKASPGSKPVSRKRTASYTVAGAIGGGAGALGLLAANRILRSSDAKMKSKNAFKRGLKSTLLVTAKTGSVIASSLLATVGVVLTSSVIQANVMGPPGGEEWSRAQGFTR